MVERDFEGQLERMFNQPPAFADNEDFARRVDRRLESGSRLRGVGIAAAGVIGGIIAVSQVLSSGFGLEIRDVEADSARTLDSLYQQVVDATPMLDVAGYDIGAGMFWMVSAMLVLAAGAFSTRLFDEA